MKKILEVDITKKYYDRRFQYWVDNKTDSFHHEKPFTKIVPLWPEKGTIIDIGCAHGMLVPLFLGIGHKVRYFGIDISEGFLKVARRRYPQLTFQSGNIADKTTLPKKKFEGFVACAVLMHIPFSHWDEMFTNMESLCKTGSYGYVALPIAHPNKNLNAEDTRHFTILDEAAQKAYMKKRGWKIKHAGRLDGFTTESVWRWYIVQLP